MHIFKEAVKRGKCTGAIFVGEIFASTPDNKESMAAWGNPLRNGYSLQPLVGREFLEQFKCVVVEAISTFVGPCRTSHIDEQGGEDASPAQASWRRGQGVFFAG